ncbi:MAG: bacteriohemerythrin [Planctomycetota bacterium]
MEIMPWKEEYNTNINEIDRQHKNLVKIINDLHEAMTEKKAHEILANIMDRLVEYTHSHFVTEEKYMVKYNYADYVSHKESHDKFTDQVLYLQKKLNKKTLDFSLEISTFLTDWLTNHILLTDQQYVPYLNVKK